MRTARSLIISPYLVISHARPPRSNHTHLLAATTHHQSNHTCAQEQPRKPPGSNYASPWEQPCMPPQEQPHMPPGATMHATQSKHVCHPSNHTPHEHPHMHLPGAIMHPPRSNHTCAPLWTEWQTGVKILPCPKLQVLVSRLNEPEILDINTVSCVQCICVFFFMLLLSCTLGKMFNLDLSNSQYNLDEELGVYDCKYLEIENLEKSKTNRNDLSIIHLNIRGLLNKQDQLKRLIIDRGWHNLSMWNLANTNKRKPYRPNHPQTHKQNKGQTKLEVG